MKQYPRPSSAGITAELRSIFRRHRTAKLRGQLVIAGRSLRIARFVALRRQLQDAELELPEKERNTRSHESPDEALRDGRASGN